MIVNIYYVQDYMINMIKIGDEFESNIQANKALSNYDEILSYDETYMPAYRMIGTIINHNQNGKYLKSEIEQMYEQIHNILEQVFKPNPEISKK